MPAVGGHIPAAGARLRQAEELPGDRDCNRRRRLSEDRVEIERGACLRFLDQVMRGKDQVFLMQFDSAVQMLKRVRKN